MNYHCLCTIKQFAKAKCEYLIIVPTYKTYQTGWKNKDETKTTDSELRFCGNGIRWCPHQEIVSQNNETAEEIDIPVPDVCVHCGLEFQWHEAHGHGCPKKTESDTCEYFYNDLAHTYKAKSVQTAPQTITEAEKEKNYVGLYGRNQ